MFRRLRKLLTGAGADTARASRPDGLGENPDSWEAMSARAQELQREGKLGQSLELYDTAIAAAPGRAELHYKRANALGGLARYEDALAGYDQAVALDACHSRAFCNRGFVLERLDRRDQALASYDRALELDPADALTHYNRGSLLKDLGRSEDAIASYDAAIGSDPNFAEAFVNRGNLLQERLHHPAAIQSFDRAIALKPAIVEAWVGRGKSLFALRRLAEASEAFSAAMNLAPDTPGLVGMRCESRLYACNWDDLETDVAAVVEGIQSRRLVASPLVGVAVTKSPSLQLAAAKIWIRDQVLDADTARNLERLPALSGPPSQSAGRKLHVGYFSSDFRLHPVANLAAGLFERHDRSRFEITAFAFGPEVRDPMVARLQAAFDRFVDVRRLSDADVVLQARRLGVDIAVDLNGFTEHCRSRIFALRAAPIQVSYLGYPGTMGASFMDYLIVDGIVVPRSQQEHYAENLLYLPSSFMPFDSGCQIADRSFTREEQGLPSSGFVYCCFNNHFKILPEIFDCWARILRRVEGSVLWLRQAGDLVRQNLRAEMARRGVDPGRLVFAQALAGLPEHLARIRLANLFLDTYPYNAHTTAMDALWAGVPVLTYAGETFASRVAASLLSSARLEELVVASLEQYEELAVALAAGSGRLDRMREGLSRRDAPIFDTALYTRNLEALYETIYQRYCTGAVPRSVDEHLAT